MPLQATSGAASYDAFGGGVAAIPNYIEDVFSTYLYKGNDTSQAITNNIDLSGNGGMVLVKSRTSVKDNIVWDTARGVQSRLTTNNTAAAFAGSTEFLSSFNSTGFTVTSTGSGSDPVNDALTNYVSWTFRKQPKFFDVVTYTGDGTNGRAIAHSLGSVPGCYIVKRTEDVSSWAVYHRSLNGGTNPQNYFVTLNTTNAQATNTGYFGTAPTSTSFYVSGNVNASGSTYVVYLFAHDAGGFGLTGTDNVISCGSYTGNGSTAGPVINLGWEPQWVLIKRTNTTGSWFIFDNMRGFSSTSQVNRTLIPNADSAEPAASTAYDVYPTSTGFQPNTVSTSFNASGSTYIYIAIRRGPMKVPTSGTSVFSPNAYAGTSSAQTQTTNFPVDLMIDSYRSVGGKLVIDRLRGSSASLETQSTAAEDSLSNIGFDSNTGVKFLDIQLNSSGTNYIAWNFQRAPSFFDEVCYTGTGVARTVAHNLGAVPELMIVKSRGSVTNWRCYVAPLGNTNNINLDSTGAVSSGPTIWNSTTPTSSVFSVGTSTTTNASAGTYVAYLFATCAGVSKVGSYTGTATTKQVDCGFTSGARFVLIKRTDSAGDWYVWDSARGIVAGNDPYLLLNSAAAEVTSTDYVDTYSAGFEISSTAPAAINASGGTFIFLAIA